MRKVSEINEVSAVKMVVAFNLIVLAGLGLVILCGGCVDYAKLSAGSHGDGSEAQDTSDMTEAKAIAPKQARLGSEVDGAAFFVEEDMTTDPSDMGAAAQDMPQLADMIAPPPSDMAKPCTTTLTGAGQGDFQIRFRLNTTVFMNAGIVSQRSFCGFPVDGYWDTRLIQVSGQMKFEIGSGGGGTTITTPGAVNDGPHDILVNRVSGVVSIYVDGAFKVAAPSNATIGTLPNLFYSSYCESMPTGGVTQVCITK